LILEIQKLLDKMTFALLLQDGETDEPGHSNGFGQSRLHKVTEPVDTIFVKSVRDNSPSAYAGLCVGMFQRKFTCVVFLCRS